MFAPKSRLFVAIISICASSFLLPQLLAESRIALITTENTVPPGIATIVIGSTKLSEPKITNVTVYLGDRKLDDHVTYPPEYNFISIFTNDVPGDFVVTARGVDETGAIVTSDPVVFHYPTRAAARFIYPTNGAQLFVGKDVKIQVEPILDRGSIDAMSIYHPDATYMYEFDQSPPYEYVWRPQYPGTYTFSASPFFSRYGYGESTENVTLTILPESLPFINRQPYGHYIDEGQDFQLWIESVSRGEQRYQWLLNGIPIADATNSTYNIQNAEPSDAGYYSVLVDNFAGRVSSAVSHLHFNGTEIGGGKVLFANTGPGIDAPIVANPAGVELEVKLFAGVSIDAMRPYEPGIKTTNGYFNGGVITLSNIPPGGKAFVQVAAVKTQNFLHSGSSKILEITAGDAEPAPLTGLESFALYNWDTVFLSAWFDRATPTNAFVGSTAELKIEAYVFYPQTNVRDTNVWLQWRKNGRLIPGATNSVLRLENVQIDDAGWYSVLATDRVRVSERGMALSVLHALKLSQSEAGELTFRANPGARYTVESSPDLETWTVRKSLTAAGEQLTIPATPPATGQVFYRVIAEP
jgi:hypothetical protein